jgi:hypothetical protein
MVDILEYTPEEENPPSLLDFLEGYPGAVKEQFMQGAKTLSRHRQDATAAPIGAAQMLYSPVAPTLEFFYDRVAHLLGPNLNKMWRAQHEAHNKFLTDHGVSTKEYQDVTRKQLAAPLAIAGSLMRGRWMRPSIMAVLKAKQKKASGRQWLAELGREGGAELREIRQMDVLKLRDSITSVPLRKSVGLEEFLKHHPGTLSTEDMLGLLGNRQIPLQEEVLKQTRVPREPMYLEDAKEFYGITDDTWENLTSRERQAYLDELREGLETGQLRPNQLFDDTRYADDHNLNLQIESPHNYKEILLRLPVGYLPSVYQDPHYPMHENVIVNIRINEGLVGEEKALILQEVESTLHQKAAGLRRAEVERVRQDQQISRGKAEDLVPQDWAYVPDENGRIRVPNAPYKKTWHELGFKRALMEALKDPTIKRLVWTDANTQSIRANGHDWEQNPEAIELHKLFSDLYDKKLVQFSKKFLKQAPVKASSDLFGMEDEWIIGNNAEGGYLSHGDTRNALNLHPALQTSRTPDSIVTFSSEQEALEFLYSPASDHLGPEWEVGQMGAGKNLKSIDLEDIRKRFKVEIRGEDVILLPLAQREDSGLLGSYA